jgi:hypothetical protein
VVAAAKVSAPVARAPMLRLWVRIVQCCTFRPSGGGVWSFYAGAAEATIVNAKPHATSN